MDKKQFLAYLQALDKQSISTLTEKNARYSDGEDMLHNFRKGAEISGMTLAQTAWGYLTKHLVALRDMIQKDDFSDTDDFLEKCQDTINYIRFIWAIGNEKENSYYPEIGCVEDKENFTEPTENPLKATMLDRMEFWERN